MDFKDIFSAPFKVAGFGAKVFGRIVIGIVGFIFMGAGLLLISPLDLMVAGLPVFAIGLILTVRAIF
jgi:hypothetical protein